VIDNPRVRLRPFRLGWRCDLVAPCATKSRPLRQIASTRRGNFQVSFEIALGRFGRLFTAFSVACMSSVSPASSRFISDLASPVRDAAGALAAGLIATALLGGCATPRVDPPTLTAESGATSFSARSLRDVGLHRFLGENLGREPEAWDFDTLCWVGFYFHPSLELARAQWATARATQRTAGQRPNPSVTLSPGYNFTREAGVSPWMPGVNFDFLLPTSGKRARQQDIARADVEVSRLGVLTAAWQLRSDLRKALADANTAGRRAALLRTQAEVQQRLLTLLEQRYAAGSIAVSDVSTTRSGLLRAEAAAADAESQAATARARVATALGLPLAALAGVTLPAPPIALSLSTPALAEARRQALRSRADVLAALAKYQSAQATLELEMVKRMPDIHLGPGYQWDQGQNKWTLGLTFELPIFNRNEGPIGEAVALRAEAAAQFNVVQGQAVGAIDTAIAALQASATQLDHAHRLRAETEKQIALAQQRLELGSADQVEVQTARLDLATVDTALLDAENAAAVAAGQLEDALQIPFSNLATLADPARATAIHAP
jgi:outer membrane protein, heavy metal efflux system